MISSGRERDVSDIAAVQKETECLKSRCRGASLRTLDTSRAQAYYHMLQLQRVQSFDQIICARGH